MAAEKQKMRELEAQCKQLEAECHKAKQERELRLCSLALTGEAISESTAWYASSPVYLFLQTPVCLASNLRK